MKHQQVGFFSLDHLHVESYLDCVNKRPQTDIRGLWHHDGKVGKQRAKQLGTKFYANAEDLVDDGIDAAVVCSANRDHERDTKLLARAGIPTLCEKPLGVTAAQAAKIIKAYRTTNTSLMTAFPCRFIPAMIRARELVLEGAIGEVMAASTTNRGTYPGDWFADKKRSGGGAILDHTVHVVDLLRWTLQSEAKTVFAESSNKIRNEKVEDTGLLMMEFRNKAQVSLDTSWSRPGARYPTWGDVTLELVGSEGILAVDGFAQVIDVYSNRHEKGMQVPYGDNPDALMIDAFLRAAAEHSEPPINGRDGLRAVEVAEAAYRSISARKSVTVEHHPC